MINDKTTPLRSMWKYDNISGNGFGSAYYCKDSHILTPPIHHHDYYEIVYYMGSSPLKYYNEGKEYILTMGDIAVSDMFKDHKYYTDDEGDYSRISIGISALTMSEFSHKETNLFQIFNPQQLNYPVYHMDMIKSKKYIDIIDLYIKQQHDSEKMATQRALIHLLLAYIYQDCCIGLSNDNKNLKRIELISNITEYIEIHSSEWISLESMAKAVNYSESYISKVFKETTGENISQYVLRKRIERSSYMIGNGISISESAESCGFDNYSYFYRAFKKIKGIGPKEYKENKSPK